MIIFIVKRVNFETFHKNLFIDNVAFYSNFYAIILTQLQRYVPRNLH